MSLIPYSPGCYVQPGNPQTTVDVSGVFAKLLHPKFQMRTLADTLLGSESAQTLELAADYLGPAILSKLFYITAYKGVVGVIALPHLECNSIQFLEALAIKLCGCSLEVYVPDASSLPTFLRAYQRRAWDLPPELVALLPASDQVPFWARA
jgi:hypothetical protein